MDYGSDVISHVSLFIFIYFYFLLYTQPLASGHFQTMFCAAFTLPCYPHLPSPPAPPHHQLPFFPFAWQIRAYCLPPQDRFPSQPQPQQVPTTYKFYTVGQVLLLPTWKLNQTS